jgi:uncharacterized protein YndB with AHSA1/START domain
MSQDPHNATVVTTPSDLEIGVTRTFEAPRELVWRLWNDPERIPEFWGPRGTTARVEEYDLRPGGRWRIVNIMADGSEIGFGGEFREVDAPERIVRTFAWDGAPGEVLETLRLDEHDGRTTISSISLFETKEQRDGMLASGMEKGATETHDRFDELLSRAGRGA